MHESFEQVNNLYCEQICDKWSPKYKICIWKAVINNNGICYYNTDQKIHKMKTETHHLKAWTDSYIAELQ